MIAGMKNQDAPSFPGAIYGYGQLSPDFRDYAQDIIAEARVRHGASAVVADDQMTQGLVPDVNGFSSRGLIPVDAIEMRTRLSDFTLDDRHMMVIHTNRHMSVKLHSDFEEAKRGDSDHHKLHRTYERARYSRYVDHLSTATLLQGHSQTPGMQPYLLDISDPYGYMLASVIFQVGNRAAYCSYHIYRPDLSQQQIGRFSILATMMTLKAAGCDHFYIGLFQPTNAHYRWKSRLKPAELFIDGQWLPFNSRTENIIRKRRHAAPASSASPKI